MLATHWASQPCSPRSGRPRRGRPPPPRQGGAGQLPEGSAGPASPRREHSHGPAAELLPGRREPRPELHRRPGSRRLQRVLGSSLLDRGCPAACLREGQLSGSQKRGGQWLELQGWTWDCPTAPWGHITPAAPAVSTLFGRGLSHGNGFDRNLTVCPVSVMGLSPSAALAGPRGCSCCVWLHPVFAGIHLSQGQTNGRSCSQLPCDPGPALRTAFFPLTHPADIPPLLI